MRARSHYDFDNCPWCAWMMFPAVLILMGQVLEIDYWRIGQIQISCEFVVKNGSTVLFWHDMCCANQPLKDQFPDLCKMARFKDATMQQVVSWNGDQNHWNIIFLRSPND